MTLPYDSETDEEILSKTVNVEELVVALQQEAEKLSAQVVETIKRLREEFDWVPKRFVVRQLRANDSIHSPERSAGIRVDLLKATIRDLIEKYWITEDGKPKEA